MIERSKLLEHEHKANSDWKFVGVGYSITIKAYQTNYC